MSDSEKSRVKRLLTAQSLLQKKSQTSTYPIDKATKRVLAPFVPIVRKSQEIRKDHEDALRFSIQQTQQLTGRKVEDVPAFFFDLLPKLHETVDILKITCRCPIASLFLVDYATNRIYQSFRDDEIGQKIKWSIRDSRIVAAAVAKNKEYVFVDDILTDERFPDGIGYYDETLKSVLCVPVLTPDGDCIAVIQLVRYHDDQPFNNKDLKVTVTRLEWIGIAVQQYQQKLVIQQQKELNDALLELTQRYFTDNQSSEKIISEIVKFAKSTLKAERGSFFVLDKDNGELIADLYDEGIDDLDNLHKKAIKIRFGKNRGIVNLVAKTGLMINIKDAYEDSRFNREIDKKRGFITKAIICMPVRSNEDVLGVIQIINKKNGSYFTNTDEDLFKIFANYCTVILHYMKTTVQTRTTFHINNIYMKILKQQWLPCIHDLEYFQENPIKMVPTDFDTFDYYITPNLEMKMPHLCLQMYYKLINPTYFNTDILMKFILTVRKLYRNNIYHNFEHAFNVFHCMYNILFRNMNKFSMPEIRALAIAALCHDIDHVGFTNNFLQLINDDLALLYEESPLENHHYHMTIVLLNDFQIFNSFDEFDYKLFLREIKDAILATDLALYFKNRHKLTKILAEDSFEWKQFSHKQMVKAIMMTSCDLSGCCKPYPIAKQINDNLYKEFYRQGDEEKKMGLRPLPLMDRSKQNTIPEDQIQFLTAVVLPCIELLKTLLPNTERMYQNTINLRKAWMEIIETRNMKTWRQDQSIFDKQLI